MIAKFLSDKWNLLGIQFICYFMLGYIFTEAFPISTILLIFVLLMMIQLTTYIRAMADGMKFNESTHLYNKFVTDEYKKLLDKYNKSKGRKK